jgi:hypothetical protein
MAIRVKPKYSPTVGIVSSGPFAKVPAITGARISTPNIIIRAIRIMLMDIRMLLWPKQTAEELEKYSQFADMANGRR